jgi:hypothetical protein
MEMVRTSTAPGRKYPSYSATKFPAWVVILGGAVCLAIWVVLKYLQFTMGKTEVLILILPGIAIVLAYFLAHRIRAHLDPIRFVQEGFLWRDEIHRWDVSGVEQRELSNGLVEVSMEFAHRGARTKRSLWLSKNQDPNGLFLELRWVTREKRKALQAERSHGVSGDVISGGQQESL